MDKVLFIDGHNFIWRANITFGEAKYKHIRVQEQEKDCICGQPWNFQIDACPHDYVVIFNFFRNLRPIIEQFSPDKCFFVLEGHPQFRYDLYAGYKANRLIKTASREKDQAKFFYNRDLIVPLLQHLPITQARARAYECDDVIATLCENLKTEALTVVSTDTDYIQLLQKSYPSIQIYNPIKKTYMEAPTYPYVAWKCLAGDKSDNIPPLLKPKKAVDTVSSPALFKKFLETEENRANFSIHRQLIEFQSVPLEEIEMQEGERNFQFLYDAFSQMKFETIVRSDTWKRYMKTFDCIKF